MMFVGVALVVKLSGIGATVTVWLVIPSLAVWLILVYSFLLKVWPPCDLRFVAGGGAGVKVLKSERAQLDLDAGLDYPRETFWTDCRGLR